MTFDLYASLHGKWVKPEASAAHDLASGFADDCLVWSVKGDKDRQNARRTYQQEAAQLSSLTLPKGLAFDPDWMPTVPGWFSLAIDFELQAPWYSKDDRPFHVLDNPVRKDRVFGVPFMSAASWKGLLRWACRMEAGLLEDLGQSENKHRKKDPEWIEHLFGKEKGEQEDFLRGALAFRPTWFDKVGFELINPHDRKRRAGTVPITYEVVPGRRVVRTNQGEQETPGAQGSLRLLYAPLPGSGTPKDTFDNLFAAIEKLLTVYGFSAKRTAGWGLATVSTWKVAGVGGVKADIYSCADALTAVAQVRSKAGGQP